MYKLRIITPVWSGDIDSKSKYIQSSGILGSIRWWTEAMLRTLEYSACDPTKENKKGRCPMEKNNKKHYCHSCLILGATGLRRSFRIEINEGNSAFNGSPLPIKPDRRNHGWYLRSGLVGELDMEIIPLNPIFEESLISVPLAIVLKWGAIGAKTQLGYGVAEFKSPQEIKIDDFEVAISKIKNDVNIKNYKLRSMNTIENHDRLPNIREFFFAKIQFEVNNGNWWQSVDGLKNLKNNRGLRKWINYGSIPIVPTIKNWLRYGEGKRLWSTGNRNTDQGIENWLLGTTKQICKKCLNEVRRDRNDRLRFWCNLCRDSLEPAKTFERISSKINISCAYPVNYNKTLWEFRIWGWIPRNGLLGGFNREEFLNSLKRSLEDTSKVKISWTNLLGGKTENHKLKVWREYNSERDTVRKEEDIEAYLQSLLEEEGEK